ncbi:hypothetical protein [Streptomyces virginiae]|uniref:hypothetical protein n=1 Tax=Streptomyces virginiae TaxID=1961 RepID=UPI002DB6CE1E|nr:hypothetical protein [Streptomyces sp. CMAA1738]MEC4572504.1 hypothetical protein [Streptomyces sp. CMAA1738]
MARTRQTPVIGVALILLLTGCEGGGTPDGESSANGARFTPLVELEGISPGGDPPADMAGPVKVLSELQYGQSRLTAYVKADSYGFIAAPKSDTPGHPAGSGMHLVSTWPADGEGSDRYPAGPYSSASGAGDPNAWASVLCSRNAMVIEYASGAAGAPEQARGHVTVTQVGNTPATLRIVIGDHTARQQIVNRA